MNLSSSDGWSAAPGADLGVRCRLLLLAGSSAALWAASPGVLALPRLSLPLGVLGLALWALAACRTGPWRKTLEALAGFAYGAPMMAWVGYVTPPSVVWIGVGWGLYYLLAGVLLRRLLHNLGLPLAAALAYTAGEGLRTLLPTPFGISWVRMGHLFSDWPSLRGAAAWIGVDGLSFLAAALGGLLAILLLRSPLLYKESGAQTRLRAQSLGRSTQWQVSWVLGLLLLAALAGRTRQGFAAGFQPGPRVLVVQPGFTQERKRAMNTGFSVTEMVDRQLYLTLTGLAAERDAGHHVDLVAWGETMLPLDLVGDTLLELSGRPGGLAGLSWPEWDVPAADAPEFLKVSRANEDYLLGRLRKGLFLEPTGLAARDFLAEYGTQERGLLGSTALFSGVLIYDVLDGGPVRRTNAVTLWDAAGKRRGAAWKRNLVPGAEGIWGLEGKAWARDLAGRLMPYVPDFRAGPRTGVLELQGPVGTPAWRIAGAVCFDNGFENVFLEGATEGRADFTLVASNEAWYEDSYEFDQMIAMSRLWAVESGRAILRATNSGISGLWDAAGDELGRIEVEGQDRAVTGVRAWTVPVPAGAGVPFFAHFGPWFKWLSVLVPLLLIALYGLFGGRR